LKKQSPVWGFPAENGRKIKEMKSIVLMPKEDRNTTNMISHIEYNHRSEYLKVKTKASKV